MDRSIEQSETFQISALLAMAGGFMDAYSYMCRGQVFANAQTGNILLFGVNLAQGRLGEALYYLFPILAFACGITFANFAGSLIKERSSLHWRQVMLLVEILIFVYVGMLTQSANVAANALISAACGIQLESFRTIRGNSAATTMCIGNLRSMTDAFCDWLRTKNEASLRRALLFGGVIVCFAVGAVLGDLFVLFFAERAIWLCNGFLFAAFVLMFIDEERLPFRFLRY